MKIITGLVFLLGLLQAPVFSQQSVTKLVTTFKFDFSKGRTLKGFTKVPADAIYSASTGFGYDFETPGSMPAARYFSIAIPEGDYDIVVKFGDATRASTTTLKAESRRLLVNGLSLKAGEFQTRKFTIHVKSPIIPGNQKVSLKSRELGKLDWDDRLSFEINGTAPAISSLEIRKNEKAITVFLAGNSTVVDQDDEPWASWGQMIPSFFKQGVSISNHAESGLSLGSFIGSKRLTKISSEMKTGDYLFIEFGHNDQKEKGPEDGAFKSYTERLKLFIRTAKDKGVIPVLVTPTSRRSFDSTGKITNSLGDYPAAMKQVAIDAKVALIDLNAMTSAMFQAMGAENSKKAFVHYPAGSFPGQVVALKDDTHFNGYGAYEIARCIIMGIQENRLELATYLIKKEDFTPSHPDAPAGWNLSLSPKSSTVKPDGN